MSEDDYDALLSDWIICPDKGTGSVFLAGRVEGDRKGRFLDGAYITTSLVMGPAEEIADGRVIATLNSRYLLAERHTVDDALFRKLDDWLAEQTQPVTVFDVLAAGDGELFAAYVLRAIRAAAADAVRQRETRH